MVFGLLRQFDSSFWSASYVSQSLVWGQHISLGLLDAMFNNNALANRTVESAGALLAGSLLSQLL